MSLVLEASSFSAKTAKQLRVAMGKKVVAVGREAVPDRSERCCLRVWTMGGVRRWTGGSSRSGNRAEIVPDEGEGCGLRVRKFMCECGRGGAGVSSSSDGVCQSCFSGGAHVGEGRRGGGK